MKKLKIGYLIKYFYPIQGGAENYMLNLALLTVKDGHEVHVFTSDRKGKDKGLKFEENYKGIQIHRCRLLFDFTHYFFLSPSLMSKLLKQELDILHVSGFGFVWHDFILIIKRIKSRKTEFINTPHGPFMALSSYILPLRLIKFIYTNIQKLFLNWLYDVILEDNTFQWRWIVKYRIDKEKIKLVTPGLDSEVISKQIDDHDLREFTQKYFLKDKFIISCLGRISKYKGIQDVIEIMPDLVKFKSNIAYLVMGRDDGYARTLKMLAEKGGVKNNIRFIIDISEKEKILALESSQIFIFPSEWEAFGIVILEAMCRGNAIISTKTEGGKYLVTEGMNGFLYNSGDNKELYSYIVKLIKDKMLLGRMQKENKLRVRRFSWEGIYKEKYTPIIYSHYLKKV